jgi:hypothetical protein
MEIINTAIVTGGANGIGKAIAARLGYLGFRVIIADIDETKGSLIAESLPDALFIKTDVSNESDILNLFKNLDENQLTVNVLINNAGISKFKPFIQLTTIEWDEVINTNLRSAFLLSREFAKRHIKGTPGRIINIASTRHLMSEPDGEAYAASKGGLVSLTHAQAISLSNTGITVNCISPGWIHTGDESALCEDDHLQHPSGRVGNPSDVASLCAFLCSSESDFITGQDFCIDGGITKKMIYR